MFLSFPVFVTKPVALALRGNRECYVVFVLLLLLILKPFETVYTFCFIRYGEDGVASCSENGREECGLFGISIVLCSSFELFFCVI